MPLQVSRFVTFSNVYHTGISIIPPRWYPVLKQTILNCPIEGKKRPRKLGFDHPGLWQWLVCWSLVKPSTPGLCICVRGTRTQPLIFVGCSVHFWVSCAINKGGFLRLHFRRRHTFASLWCANSCGDSKNHYGSWWFLCPQHSSFKGLLRSDILSS